MEYEIIWTEPAGLQLQEIHEYIAAEDPTAARRVVEKIIACVEQLGRTPRIGTVYRKSGKHPIRKVVSGKYRIFYRVLEAETRVEILVVWHGARRDPKFKKDKEE
jgi:toxin ParE1/3/4